jgi:hypothetical protein
MICSIMALSTLAARTLAVRSRGQMPEDVCRGHLLHETVKGETGYRRRGHIQALTSSFGSYLPQVVIDGLVDVNLDFAQIPRDSPSRRRAFRGAPRARGRRDVRLRGSWFRRLAGRGRVVLRRLCRCGRWLEAVGLGVAGLRHPGTRRR